MDLDAYRAEGEAFVSALDREFLLHFSGRQESFEIEPIYDRHAKLFDLEAVNGLREASSPSLLEFAVQGLIGRETKEQAAELARREAALEVDLDGERIPLRQAPIVQANEPLPERRAALEAARLELVERELEPLMRETLERSHELAGELGWPSMRAMCAELSGIDLGDLGRQAGAFLSDTEGGYEPLVEPRLEAQLGLGFDRLSRADLPAFFRASGLDRLFPGERLLTALESTLDGLEIDGSAPPVLLDAEARPTKSPRAFCAPVRVPDEVHLVIPRVGGRDDFEALFHEAGHAYHFSHVDPALPFEHRYLGDNSVTEGFAFLFQHLCAEPEWLERRLGVEDPLEVTEHARAARLVFLRRYAAKLTYELELHDAPADLDKLRSVYAERLSSAVHVDWPAQSWLSDVDPFFYAARYLRAWALEAHLRSLLRERFGGGWFEDPGAGALLRELWRSGQATGADQLLLELSGERLDLSWLAEDVGVVG